RQIIEVGASSSAAQAFRALYRLQALRPGSERLWNQIDVLLTPTAGTIYRIAEVEADPVRLNSRLGYYTNCVNLLDLAAITCPSGMRGDGLPSSLTLIRP